MQPYDLSLVACLDVNDHDPTKPPPSQATCESLLSSLGRTELLYLTEPGDWLILNSRGEPYPLERGRKFARHLCQAGLVRITERQLRNIYFVQDFLGSLYEHRDKANHIPTVNSMVRVPALMFDATGTRLVQRSKGFHAGEDTNTLCVPGPLNTDLLPEVDPQYPHLKTVFSGFFTDPLCYANLMAIVLATFARTAIQAFPIILIDADRKSSGKSTLANAITYLLTGRDAVAVIYTGNETEFEGRFKSIINKPGPNFILVDNVRAKQGVGGQIRSQFLSSVSGSHATQARTLYTAPAPVFSPVVFMTMNGARVERDLGDKIVRISLRLPPGAQHRLIDPEPKAYLMKHRCAVFAEALHLLTSLEYPPSTSIGLFKTRFFDFERVAVTAGRALGLEPSFDPGRVVTADSLITEVYDILQDAFDSVPVTFIEVVQKARAAQNLRELNEWIRATHRTEKGAAIELRQLIEENYAGRIMKVARAQGEFIVGQNSSNQYTLSFKENGPADCTADATSSPIITSNTAVESGTLPAQVV